MQFASTNARNVVYNTQQQALQAARAMIVVNPSDVLHARYLIGPKGKDEPKMEPTDVRIEIKRDKNNSDPGEGFVEEYITDHGPMISRVSYSGLQCEAEDRQGGTSVCSTFPCRYATGQFNRQRLLGWGEAGGSTPAIRDRRIGCRAGRAAKREGSKAIRAASARSPSLSPVIRARSPESEGKEIFIGTGHRPVVG